MKPSSRVSESLGYGILLLVLLCALLYLPGISARDLWRPDEVRYTEVAREMDVTGSLFLLRLNDMPYPDKPPLFFWLTILVSKILGGWSPVPARIVSALGAMGTVVLTFLTARRLGMHHAALAAGIVLASATQFLWITRWGVMDTTYSFFILLTLYAFLQSRLGRRAPWLFVAYLSVSMAILAKGPLGILIVGLVVGATIAYMEGPRRLLSGSLLWGVPLVILPVAVWLVPDILQAGGWEHGKEVIFGQNIGRLKPSAGQHVHSIFYYLINFPADFLPWAFFLPGAIYLLFRDTSMPRETRVFLVAYFVGCFLLLSLLPPKRQKYLLPVYPSAAILIGHLLTYKETLPFQKTLEKTVRIPGRILAWLSFSIGLLALVVALLGVWAVSVFAPEVAPVVESILGPTESRVCLLVAGLLVLTAGLFSFKPMRKNPRHTSLVLIPFVLLVVSTGMGTVLLPKANAFKSVKQFCGILDQRMEERTPVGVYRNLYQGEYNFYLGRNHVSLIYTPDGAKRFLSGPDSPVLILTEQEFSQIQDKDGTDFQVLVRGRFEKHMMLAITPVPPG